MSCGVASEVIARRHGLSPGRRAAPRGRECLIAPAEALARLGIEPASGLAPDVTHCHWDHIGNLDRFEAAELFVPARRTASSGRSRSPATSSSGRHVEPDGVALLESALACRGACGDRWQHERSRRGCARSRSAAIRPASRCSSSDGSGDSLASDAVHLYEELELERPFSVVVNLPEMVRPTRC